MEGTLAEDVSDHNGSDKLTLLTIRLTKEKVASWLFSTQGQGSHGVHNQVDPQELHSGQRSTILGNSTKEGNDKGDDVNGKLELKELSDVIVDTSTPQYTTGVNP